MSADQRPAAAPEDPAPRALAWVSVDGRLIAFSSHAVRRWHERCRPASCVREALRDLTTEVARNGRISQRRPRGVEMSLRHQLHTVGWVTLRDQSASFPLVNYDGLLVATTCIGRKP